MVSARPQRARQGRVRVGRVPLAAVRVSGARVRRMGRARPCAARDEERAVQEIDTREALSQLHIVYVMTDFTASNVNSWENDQAFQSHVSSGLLDFAIYDVDDPITQINLIRSGVQLSCETPAINPILAIANYVLDSLRMDAFRVFNGRLQEALVSTYVKSSQHQTWLEP